MASRLDGDPAIAASSAAAASAAPAAVFAAAAAAEFPAAAASSPAAEEAAEQQIGTHLETADDSGADEDDDLSLNYMGEAAVDPSEILAEAGDPSHLSENIRLLPVGHPDRLLGSKRAKNLVLTEAQESSVQAKMKGLHDFQELVIKESFAVAIQDFEDRFNTLKDNIQGYFQQLFCDHFVNPKPSKKRKYLTEDTDFGDDVQATTKTVSFAPLEREVSNDIIFEPLRDSPSFREKFDKKEKKKKKKKIISNDYKRLQQHEKKVNKLQANAVKVQEKAALKKAIYEHQKLLAPRSVFDEIGKVGAKPEQAKKKKVEKPQELVAGEGEQSMLTARDGVGSEAAKTESVQKPKRRKKNKGDASNFVAAAGDDAAAKTAAETRTAAIVAAGDSVASAGDSAAPEANQEQQLQEQEQEEKKNKEKPQAVKKKLQEDKFDRHYNTPERKQLRENDRIKCIESNKKFDLSDDEDPEAVKAAEASAAAASEAPGAVVAAAASTPAARFTASAAGRGKKEKATGAGAAATGAGAKKNKQAKPHELSFPEATEEQCSTCDDVLGKGHCPACIDRIDYPPELPSRQHTQRFNYQVVLYSQTLALSSHIHILKVVV